MNLFLFFVCVCVCKNKNWLYSLKCWRQSSRNLPCTKGNEIFRCDVLLLLCCSAHCFHQLAGESLQSKAGKELFGHFWYRVFPCASHESTLVNLDIRGVVWVVFNSIYLHNGIWKYMPCQKTLFKKAFVVTVVGYSQCFLTALEFTPSGCSLTQLGPSSCLADNWKGFVFTSGTMVSLAGLCMQQWDSCSSVVPETVLVHSWKDHLYSNLLAGPVEIDKG